MAIDIADLITSMKIHAPIGVELPRDPETDEIHEPTIERWASDAAQKISARRGRTTRKETEITCEAAVQEYDLPDDCRSVIKIDRQSQMSDVLDIPTHRDPIFGFGIPGGVLPSGQEISPSLDLIARQRLSHMKREDEYELIGVSAGSEIVSQIRFLFPISAGEVIKVTYKALDRDLESLPEDYFTLVLKYLLFQNLDHVIGKHGAQPVVTGDSFDENAMTVFFRRRGELESEWIAGLNSIGQEAN